MPQIDGLLTYELSLEWSTLLFMKVLKLNESLVQLNTCLCVYRTSLYRCIDGYIQKLICSFSGVNFNTTSLHYVLRVIRDTTH